MKTFGFLSSTQSLANWKELSGHEEEENCMEGTWASSDPSYIVSICQEPHASSKMSLMTNICIVQICETNKQRVRIKAEAVEFTGEFPYLERQGVLSGSCHAVFPF